MIQRMMHQKRTYFTRKRVLYAVLICSGGLSVYFAWTMGEVHHLVSNPVPAVAQIVD